MKKRDRQPNTECVICGAESIFQAHAVIAPWISMLCGQKKHKLTSLNYCNKCDLAFFSHRYSEQEMAGLYSGYRGEYYFNVRRRFEPWFTRSTLNYWDPSKNPTAVAERRDYMSENLQTLSVELDTNSAVLDFGGDLGQFFPDGLTGKKYLFDPSDTGVPGEITRVKSLASLNSSLGLVMNCHTLEHLPVLQGQAQTMANLLTQNGYLYIEVPLDRFKTSGLHKTSVYRVYIHLLLRITPVFIFTDFFSGVYRLLFGKIPFWGIVKQSEHLNYFSKESLLMLVRGEVEVIGVSQPDLRFGQGRIKVGRIAMVAKKRKG